MYFDLLMFNALCYSAWGEQLNRQRADIRYQFLCYHRKTEVLFGIDIVDALLTPSSFVEVQSKYLIDIDFYGIFKKTFSESSRVFKISRDVKRWLGHSRSKWCATQDPGR